MTLLQQPSVSGIVSDACFVRLLLFAVHDVIRWIEIWRIWGHS